MAPPQLSEDEIDDLIYLARTGETADFRDLAESLSLREGCDLAAILDAAVDPESGNGALHMAAANGHTDIIAYIVKTAGSGLAALLGRRNKAGNTPLHWAALNGHVEAVRGLVEAGADPYVQNAVGHDAIYEAEVNDRREAVEWMLKEGGLEGLEGEGEAEGEGEEGVSEEGLREQLSGLEVGEGKGKEKASS